MSARSHAERSSEEAPNRCWSARAPLLLAILSDTLLSLLLYFLWRMAVDLSFRHSPGTASVALLTIVSAFLCLYARKNASLPTHNEKPSVGFKRRWGKIGLIMASWMVLKCSLFALWHVPSNSFSIQPGGYVSASFGWFPVLLASTIAIPLIEETFLRGFIQGRLMKAVGSGVAICLTAALTGLLYHKSPGLPLIVVGALVTGPTVAWCGSIWAGVLVHSAGNIALGLYSVISRGMTPSGAGNSAAGMALLTVLLCWAGLILWSSVPTQRQQATPASYTRGSFKGSLRLDRERGGPRR